MQRLHPTPCCGQVSAALLPPADPALAVDISFLMQYWAGGRDGASKPQSAAGTLLSLLAAAAAAGVSSEVEQRPAEQRHPSPPRPAPARCS